MIVFGIENDNYIAEKNEILTFRIKNDKIVPAAWQFSSLHNPSYKVKIFQLAQPYL